MKSYVSTKVETKTALHPRSVFIQDQQLKGLTILNSLWPSDAIYRQVYNIRRTLVGNLIVGLSDVVEASPVGAASTTSSFST